MEKTPRPTEIPMVQCEVCRREIARSEAKSSEGQDYVFYFCGLDCYEQWMKDQEQEERGADSE